MVPTFHPSVFHTRTPQQVQAEKTPESMIISYIINGWNDCFQRSLNISDVNQIMRNRHLGGSPNAKHGGANYTFADGHAEYIKYYGMLYPLNLWVVTDCHRTNRAMMNYSATTTASSAASFDAAASHSAVLAVSSSATAFTSAFTVTARPEVV